MAKFLAGIVAAFILIYGFIVFQQPSDDPATNLIVARAERDNAALELQKQRNLLDAQIKQATANAEATRTEREYRQRMAQATESAKAAATTNYIETQKRQLALAQERANATATADARTATAVAQASAAAQSAKETATAQYQEQVRVEAELQTFLQGQYAQRAQAEADAQWAQRKAELIQWVLPLSVVGGVAAIVVVIVWYISRYFQALVEKQKYIPTRYGMFYIAIAPTSAEQISRYIRPAQLASPHIKPQVEVDDAESEIDEPRPVKEVDREIWLRKTHGGKLRRLLLDSMKEHGRDSIYLLSASKAEETYNWSRWDWDEAVTSAGQYIETAHGRPADRAPSNTKVSGVGGYTTVEDLYLALVHEEIRPIKVNHPSPLSHPQSQTA